MNIPKILAVALLVYTGSHFTHGQAQVNNSYQLVILKLGNNNNSFSKEEVHRMENEHMRYISRLSKAGQLANAGPFEGGGEILVMNSTREVQRDYF